MLYAGVYDLMGNSPLQLDLLLHTLLRGLYLLGIPMVINFALFYVHFAILTQSGPGNAFVSRGFRNSLEVSHQWSPLILVGGCLNVEYNLWYCAVGVCGVSSCYRTVSQCNM